MRGSSITGLECFFEIVPNRKHDTLKEVLLRRVEPESLICSDCWAGYKNLNECNFYHGRVNHSTNFLNPENPIIHTQTIECIWGQVKKMIKQKSAFNRKFIEDYMFEFIYRKKFKNTF